MRVLVACEFSGTVRDAFAARGHDAWSCDILPSERSGQHIEGDVLAVLNRGWDLMIAHPPCTYLTIAGAAYREKRTKERSQAVEFFRALQAAPIKRIAIENPIPFVEVMDSVGRYDQIINPFQFGQPIRKKICLWLKGLPPLSATEVVPLPEPKFCIRKTGTRAGRRYNYYFHQGKNAHARSRFFPAVAAAMADQWGNILVAKAA